MASEGFAENRVIRTQLLLKELNLYTRARARNNHDLCVFHLGRAHIISQRRWFHHFYIHFLMLEYSWRRKEFNECWAQFVRMFLTIPGHLFKKLPVGNTGWSSVRLNEKLPVPKDLEDVLK